MKTPIDEHDRRKERIVDAQIEHSRLQEELQKARVSLMGLESKCDAMQSEAILKDTSELWRSYGLELCAAGLAARKVSDAKKQLEDAERGRK